MSLDGKIITAKRSDIKNFLDRMGYVQFLNKKLEGVIEVSEPLRAKQTECKLSVLVPEEVTITVVSSPESDPGFGYFKA